MSISAAREKARQLAKDYIAQLLLRSTSILASLHP
jgi:hypothetical protein